MWPRVFSSPENKEDSNSDEYIPKNTEVSVKRSSLWKFEYQDDVNNRLRPIKLKKKKKPWVYTNINEWIS